MGLTKAKADKAGDAVQPACCLPEVFNVETDDGVAVAASGFTPPDPDADRGKIVIVAPTAATPRYFYASFCCYLAQQGFPAVSFDYRGVADSRPASLKNCPYTFSDWGRRDLTGVLHWLAERFPDYRLVVVGHGLGGQLPALAGNGELIAGLMTFSSASHHHEHYADRRGRRRLRAMTRFVVPQLVDRLGYVPAKRLRLGEDVPKNVFLEWARWCRHPEYLFGDATLEAPERAARLGCPVLATVIADDDWAPDQAVRALHRHYVNAAVSYWPIGPADFGLVQLGHLGPFQRPVRDKLWPLLAQWIDQV